MSFTIMAIESYRDGGSVGVKFRWWEDKDINKIREIRIDRSIDSKKNNTFGLWYEVEMNKPVSVIDDHDFKQKMLKELVAHVKYISHNVDMIFDATESRLLLPTEDKGEVNA